MTTTTTTTTKSTTSTPSTHSSPTSTSSCEAPPSIWSREYWTGMMDQQRMERLQQCHALNAIFKACQDTHHSTNNNNNKDTENPPNNKSNTTTVPQLDQAGGGIRMLLYYGWRPNPQDDMTTRRPMIHQPGCIPEHHAVWTCRAIALGCGRELSQLKNCFDQEGKDAILQQPHTAYEASSNDFLTRGGHDRGFASVTTTNKCHEFQKAVGACVASNATSLQERMQQKKQQQPTPKP